MHRLVFGIAALATLRVAAAQSAPLSPEVVKLAAIRRHMTAEIQRSREMMCLETIERRTWDAKGKPTHADRLQLEVAFVGSRELFAWPGDEQFAAHTPVELAGAGAGSSGELVALLKSIFTAPGSILRPAPSTGPLLRYDFEVPIFGSALQVTGPTGSARVGSTGAIWADPQSLDVVRVENRAKDIPVSTSISEVIRTVDYARLLLAGGASYLTPQRATATVLDLDRSVHLNRIQFSHCREFSATSQLSFEDAPAAVPLRVALPANVKARLPARLPVRVRLETEIDLAASHAGQPIAGVLVDAIQHRGQPLAPAGTVVTGRLRWLDQRQPNGVWMVGLEFTMLGEAFRFFATLDSLHDPNGQARLFASSVRRERITKSPSPMSRNPYGDVLSSFETVHGLVAEEEFRLPGVGLLTLPASATRLAAGVELRWTTE